MLKASISKNAINHNGPFDAFEHDQFGVESIAVRIETRMISK